MAHVLARLLASPPDTTPIASLDEWRARWVRDRGLALVAERARTERRARAWERLGERT